MKKYKVLIEAMLILSTFIGIYVVLSNSIDNRIDRKLKDPEFINKVASEVQLPFLIIDEKNIIHYDTGALELIENIKIEINKANEIDHIVITPNELLPTAPLIECINSNFDFAEPERIPQISWKFSEASTEALYVTNDPDDTRKPLVKRFKVTIIK